MTTAPVPVFLVFKHNYFLACVCKQLTRYVDAIRLAVWPLQFVYNCEYV